MKLSKTYWAWATMWQRCTNPKRHNYHNYGGRGITVCERWAKYENFLADMSEKPEGWSLDRIDNEGDYELGNCRWADNRTQHVNTRRNIRLEYDGQDLTITEWAERLGIKPKTLFCRYHYRWSTKDILTIPVIKDHRERRLHRRLTL